MGMFICARCKRKWPDGGYFSCPECHPRWALFQAIFLTASLFVFGIPFAIAFLAAIVWFVGWFL